MKLRTVWKVLRRLVLAGLLLALLFVNGAGFYIGNIIYTEMSTRHSRLNSATANASRLKQRLEWGKRERQWQDVAIESRFGYSLKGTFIPNPQPTTKTLVFLHGFTENRLIGLNYLNVYLSDGFNLLLIDSRAHGDSGGESVTWGVYEKHDLDQWLDWVRQKYPTGAIGVHGISMGAATALLHAEMNETSRRVSFYVADSAYSDFELLLVQQIRRHIPLPDFILPEYLLPYANLVAYFKSRFTFHEVAPVRAVRNVTTPVLYIHGEADALVPVDMSRELYRATKGPKQIQLFPEADHVSSIYQDRYRYRNVIRGFAQANRENLLRSRRVNKDNGSPET